MWFQAASDNLYDLFRPRIVWISFDHYSRLARSNNHNDALDSIFSDESLYTFIEVGPGLEHFVSLLILLDLSGDDCPASGQKCDFLCNLSSVKISFLSNDWRTGNEHQSCAHDFRVLGMDEF